MADTDNNDPNFDNSDPEKKLTIKEQILKWIAVLKAGRVEMALFLLIVSVCIGSLATQNLILEKACNINLKYNETICEKVRLRSNDSKEAEAAIQIHAAKAAVLTTTIPSVLGIVSLVLIGPLSDHYGRKIPILFGISGCILQSVLLAITSQLDIFDAYATAIIAVLSFSLLGGFSAIMTCTASYITDVSTGSLRTIRLGLFSACQKVGIPLGIAIGGILCKPSFNIPYPVIYAVAGAFSAVSFLVVMFTMKNITPKPKKEHDNEDSEDSEETKDESKDDEIEVETEKPGFKWKYLNPITICIDIVRTLFKKRSNNGRIKIMLLLGVILFTYAPMGGEMSVFYLFVRYRFNWDSSDFAAFSTYNWAIAATGTFVSIGVLIKIFHMTDPVLGLLSSLSQFAACFVYAFAVSPIMLYIAPAVDMLNGTMTVVAKSMISKIILPNEVGKMYSFIGLVYSLVFLAVVPLYVLVYTSFFKTFAGAHFMLSAVLSIPPLIVFCWFIYIQRRDARRTKKHDLKNGKVVNNVKEVKEQEMLLRNSNPEKGQESQSQVQMKDNIKLEKTHNSF